MTFYYLGGSVGATLTDWFWRWKRWPGCVGLLGFVSLLSVLLSHLSTRSGDGLAEPTLQVVD